MNFLNKHKLAVFGLIIWSLLIGRLVFALPFNDDMVHDQPNVNEVMRPLPKNSIPIGGNKNYLENKMEASKKINPIPATEASIARGERLWNVFCSPCHGVIQNGELKRKIPMSMLPGPDLRMPLYKNRPDGFFYGTIKFGGLALMPPYGSKLSEKEHWDIVNYIRRIQGVK